MNCLSIRVLAVLLGSLLIFGCSDGGSDFSVSNGSDSPSSVRMGAIIEGNFIEGQLALSLPPGEVLAARGSVTVNTVLVDSNGNPYLGSVVIDFSSDFAKSGLATIDTLVITEDGSATAIYRAAGGYGADTITAVAQSVGEENLTLSATATINVAGGIAGSINFISATPKTIALKGTGGPPRSETSLVVFMVVDENGNPAPGNTVEFKLSTEIGGLSLSDSSAVSDFEGLVQTTVNAGDVSSHVRVHATIPDSDPLITVVSDELLVSTGLPDQNSITLGAETFNPEVWNYVNVEVPIIFQAGDHFNNYVPDGTVVYFTTEGGSIDDFGVTARGVCKDGNDPKLDLIWRSGNPRPDDGRFTILAFCIGEESFTDYNGNGFFDEEDLFDLASDQAEPFRDDNDSEHYEYGEPFWDYNNDGKWTEANGIYNGTLCSHAAEVSGLCTTELVYVQKSLRLIMSGSWAENIVFSPDPVDLRGGISQIVSISIGDVNNNPMPMGTKIEFSTTNGEIVGDTSFKVPNTNKLGPLVYLLLLEPSGDGRTLGLLQVKVTTPMENLSGGSVYVLDDN